MDELMLRIDNVSKQYKLGEIGGTTLRDELQRMRAKRRGEEDPTKRIGAKEYNKGETFMALDGVSFEVKKGERVGIIGHNGAGKSTLLKLISRVTAPSGGTIYLNGRVASMLEVGTGFHGELTGRENIYMNGAILGMTKKEIDAKMEAIIDFSEVRQFIDTPVKRYSSGMYVKLAFSVAAHLDSEIMIMDEVLAVGDMAFQKKCLEKMKEVSEAGNRTILYVSHNMDTIRNLCDRCIVLDHGKIQYNGNINDGIQQYLGKMDAYSDFINLQSVKRTARTLQEGFHFHSIQLKDRDHGVYYVGEKMTVHLTTSATKPMKELRILLTVVNTSGLVIGKAESQKTICVKEHNRICIDMVVDVSILAPGKYTIGLSAYEIIANGSMVFYDDIPKHVINFEIIEKSGFNNGIRWNPDWYGNCILNPIVIELCQ